MLKSLDLSRFTGRRKRKVLVFDDPATFCAFVRLHGQGSSSKKGYERYVFGPAEGRGSQHHGSQRHGSQRHGSGLLVLAGFHLRQDSPYEFRRGAIREEDGQPVLFLDGQASPLVARDQRVAHSLFSLAALEPWRREPENLPHLLFWLANAERMTDLVLDSLRLGNDRIRYAAVGEDGRQGLIVRMEQPSYFLVQRVLEDHADEVEIFYSAAPDLFLPWGYHHPLLDIWAPSEKRTNKNWVFFQANGNLCFVEPLRFEDVYDAAQIEIAFNEEKVFQQRTSEVRFDIAMQLIPRANPAEAEVWLLGEEELPRLEHLVASLDEEDLNGLLLSVHQDSTEKRYFLVREKPGQKKRQLDFGGRAFAPYQGIGNLMLPTDRQLEPQLRRDRYRDLFSLKGGELVLVEDQTGENSGLRAWRLAEKTFEPLERLVDYIAAADDEILQQLLANTVLDLGIYAQAPRRPNLRPPVEKETSPTAPKASKEEKPKAETRKEREKKAPLEIRQEEELTPEEIAARHSIEAKAERALLSDGQSYERWRDVLEAKLDAGKYVEARIAFTDTLWLLPEGTEAAHMRNQWCKVLETMSYSDTQEALMFRILSGPDSEQNETLDAWLAECGGQLLNDGPLFRIKEQWLLWREILCHNRDVRQRARLREEIRRATESGLGQSEMPSFLRQRLFDDSRFSETAASGDDRDEDATRELQVAENNLAVVLDGLNEIADDVVVQVARAIIARAFSCILGQGSRPSALIPDIESLTKDPLLDKAQTAQARVAIYAYHAIRGFDTEKAQEYFQLYYGLVGGDSHSDNMDELTELDEVLENREKISNPTAFLAIENVERLFVRGPAQAKTKIGQLRSSLDHADDNEAIVLLKEVLEKTLTPPIDLDARDLAEYLDVVVSAFQRLRLHREASNLLRQFEKIAPELAKRQGEGDTLYLMLRDNNLARGLLEMGQERQAADLLRSAFEHTMALVDLLDGCAALLNTVETLPLQYRAPLLKNFMRRLATALEDEYYLGQAKGILSKSFYRLLDQACEAAVSKEKLALGIFRNYQQQDEFLILERVLREDPCAPREP